MSEAVYNFQPVFSWAEVQENSSKAVVHIISHIERFNWQEPYESGEQFESRGTGFFINELGHILTTLHVVDEAELIWIQMPVLGRYTMQAQIIGICPTEDIALLAISDEDRLMLHAAFGAIPFLALGNSDSVVRTQPVLSLGYPLGQHTLKGTIGVISGHESFEGKLLLQTTAPVNEGSSGGPLIANNGDVIGITIATAVDAYNVGYAIAINHARIILSDLYTERLVHKPIFGAQFISTNDDKKAYLGCTNPGGVYISKVYPGGLFEKAGLQHGDILCEFDGFPIDSYGEIVVPWSYDKISLSELASRILPGRSVSLVLFRAGEKITVSCPITRENPFAIRKRFPLFEPIEYEIVGGLVLMDLSENHLDALGNPESLSAYQGLGNKITPRVVVSHVLVGSYAHTVFFIRPGDIVTSINGVAVYTVAQVKDVLAAIAAQPYRVLLFDDGALAVFAQERLVADES